MGKKIGYFFISFIPITLAFVVQFISVFFFQGVATLFSYLNTNSSSVAEFKYNTFTQNLNFNYGVMVVYALMSICLFGIWYYWRYAADYLPKPAQTFHPLMLGAIVMLVPGTQYGATAITVVLSSIFPKWMEQYEELLENSGLADENTFLLVLYSVILAPICEELIFRGVTLHSFRRVFPFWAANILQAILFGAFHGNWIQGFYAGALGIVLGFVCEKGGNLYFSVILHILFNFWGIIISDLPLFDNDYVNVVLIVLSIFIILPSGCVLFNLGRKKQLRKNALRLKNSQTPASAARER